jgi:hypothetical protein
MSVLHLIGLPLQVMHAEELSFGISTVLSLIFGSGGALAVWFSFRNKVDLSNQLLKTLQDDLKNAHARISTVKTDLERHKEFTNEFKIEISQMELRIVKEIQAAINKAIENKN